MRHLLLCTSFLCLALCTLGQTSEIIGLNFTTGKLHFAAAVPASGSLSIVSQATLSSDQYLSGDAAYDALGDRYFYVRGSMEAPQLIAVNATTGVVLSVSEVQNLNDATVALANLVYHPIEDQLYGLSLSGGQLYLMKVDPTNGQVTLLSKRSIASGIFQSGDAAIDLVQERYLFTQGSERTQKIFSVSLSSGQVISAPLISNPNNATVPLTNLAWNPMDNLLYGLNFANSQLRFVSVNPQTGVSTLINSAPLSGDIFSTGDGAIDPATGRYFYVRGYPSRLYTVDIATGTLLSNPLLENPNSAIAPITNIAFRGTRCSEVLASGGNPLGNDTLLLGTSYSWNLNLPNASYSWWNGTTTATQTVNTSGSYWVDITLYSCTVRYTVIVEFQNASRISDVSISSFPNPTTGPLTVSLNVDVVTDGLLMIADMQGRVWWDYSLNNYSANSPIEVDLKKLPVGTYLFRYQDAGRVINQKVVKY